MTLTELVIALSQQQTAQGIKRVQVIAHSREGREVLLEVIEVVSPKELPDRVLIKAVMAGL